MFIPHYMLRTCFDDMAIALIRDGYSDNWYDALSMDESFHSYYFQTPENDGDLYITVETYSENIVPTKCTTAFDQDFFEGASDIITSPLVSVIVYKANNSE